MPNMLNSNEARFLEMTNVYEGAYVYELASAAQLAFADALLVAQGLARRGLVVLDNELRFVQVTKKGVEVTHR